MKQQVKKILVSCVVGLTVTTASLGTLVRVADIPAAVHAGACDNPNFKACAECCEGKSSCGTTLEATCECTCKSCKCVEDKQSFWDILIKILDVIF